MPSQSSAQPDPSERRAALADPRLYDDLRRYVRGRVRAGDADDVVQAALAAALAAERAPSAPEELRRWVFAIARHKIGDAHRQTRARQRHLEVSDELVADGAPHSAGDLLKWALRELPQNDSAEATLESMLREGAGDPLEEIALDNQVPAPRLRQRVSRLRRYYRARWTAQLAALGLLTLAAFFIGRWLFRSAGGPEPAPIARETPRPDASARALRSKALEDCSAARYEICLRRLDQADRLDPSGAGARDVREARDTAAKALVPKPEPSTLLAPVLPPELDSVPRPNPSSERAPSPSSVKPQPSRKQATAPMPKAAIPNEAPTSAPKPALRAHSKKFDSL